MKMTLELMKTLRPGDKLVSPSAVWEIIRTTPDGVMVKGPGPGNENRFEHLTFEAHGLWWIRLFELERKGLYLPTIVKCAERLGGSYPRFNASTMRLHLGTRVALLDPAVDLGTVVKLEPDYFVVAWEGHWGAKCALQYRFDCTFSLRVINNLPPTLTGVAAGLPKPSENVVNGCNEANATPPPTPPAKAEIDRLRAIIIKLEAELRTAKDARDYNRQLYLNQAKNSSSLSAKACVLESRLRQNRNGREIVRSYAKHMLEMCELGDQRDTLNSDN